MRLITVATAATLTLASAHATPDCSNVGTYASIVATARDAGIPEAQAPRPASGQTLATSIIHQVYGSDAKPFSPKALGQLWKISCEMER